MNYLLPILLSLSVLHASLTAAEYGYLDNLDQTVNLLEGDTLEVLSYSIVAPSVQNTVLISTPNSDIPFEFELSHWNSNGIIHTTYAAGLRTIVGPCTFRLGGTFKYYLAFKITRASELEYRNINIISIPEDTVGDDTQVVVEASSDLQNWTTVHSSTISGQKAFFRTRIITSGD